MEPRKAKSLQKLLDQVNAAYPGRSKDSDGWIGDEAHSSRTSDHNPDSRGVVHALDITKDLRVGLDSRRLGEALKASADPRIKYIISNGEIWNPSIAPGWRKYSGINPHTAHVHISVVSDPELADSTRDWSMALSGVTLKPDPSAPPPLPTIRRGSTNSEKIIEIWTLLLMQEKGFGSVLEAAVKAFQKREGLVVDGVVGSQTWEKLKQKDS